MNGHAVLARNPGSATPDVVVIGAGHAGLAMSRCLSRRGIDHVVLERGEIGNAWRHERWHSLRLLTPNWQTRLPGYSYRGNDPDGFMSARQVAGFVSDYACHIRAPVICGVNVESVNRAGDRFLVSARQGRWLCRAVVMATGAFSLPVVPGFYQGVPPQLVQLHARHYRHPDQLPAGGVLVVGCSATGLQLAEEIQRSGRPVTLATGEHVRLPRQYRGQDIQRWMDRIGLLDERFDQVQDLKRARRLPSPQLVGSPGKIDLDLNRLQDLGVTLSGRLMTISAGVARFSGSLNNVCALADLKQQRLLERIDRWISAQGLENQAPPSRQFEPTRTPEKPLLNLDLKRAGTASVVWATGYRPDYSWLKLPVFDRKGNLQHNGGIVAPGIYALGLPFMRRRKSSFIHGAEDDAIDIGNHIARHLDRPAAADTGFCLSTLAV